MVLELLLRLFRRIATPTFFCFLLLWGVMGSIAYGISEIIQGLSFWPMFNLSLVGLLLGWLFARWKLHPIFASILVFIPGGLIVYIWVGNLFSPLFLFAETIILTGQLYVQDRANFSFDPALLHPAIDEIVRKSTFVWRDLSVWVKSLVNGEPVFYEAASLFVWGMLILIVAAWAGYVYRKYGNVILSIVPSSFLLIVMMGYTWGAVTPLLPLMLSLLLLMAFNWLKVHEEAWTAHGMDYPDDARVDSVLAASLATILIVGIAFFLPRLSIRQMVEAVSEWMNPQVEQVEPVLESFGLQVGKPGVGRFGPMLSGGLPREHLIGAGPELSEQVVMEVRITGGLPPGAETNERIPLYWRGLTYDLYTGQGWNSSDVSLRGYRANEKIGVYDRPGYLILEQELRVVEDPDLLYAAGDLISANNAFKIAWRSEPWFSEIDKYPGDAFGVSTDQETNRVKSFVPVIDETALRESGWLYPDWVRENYVLVPIDTPQRVVEVTRRLIEDADTPYDRARIIENYLRQFEYSTDLPEPPKDRDIVDYFLFDLKKGYCDYFASSMVVMARAADLPARLVVGYARGTYDEASGRFVVTEADAHSWPEIYFADVGWVPFEPTAGIKAIPRDEDALVFPDAASYLIETDSLRWRLRPLFGSWPLTIVIFIVGIVWGRMVWITVDEWLLRRMTPTAMTEKLYQRLYRYGGRLKIPVQKENTPNEFTLMLRNKIDALSALPIGQKYVDRALYGVLRISDSFVQSKYSQVVISPDEGQRILIVWQNLRRDLGALRWLDRLQKIMPMLSKADHEVK